MLIFSPFSTAFRHSSSIVYKKIAACRDNFYVLYGGFFTAKRTFLFRFMTLAKPTPTCESKVKEIAGGLS